MNISRVVITIFLFIVLLFTTACNRLTQSDKPAISKWWLEPYVQATQPARVGSPVSIALSVNVVPGLDTDRILTLSDDAELGQFASARWVDHLPELLTSLTERSFQGSGQFVIVPGNAGSKPGNCLLEFEFSEFFADIGANGRTMNVRVAADVRFQCAGSDTPLVIHQKVSSPVADERMNLIVAAFQHAIDEVTRDTMDKINNHQQHIINISTRN